MVVAVDVHPRLFGGPMRMGDMIGACNFLEFLREFNQMPELALYIPNISVSITPSHHCFKMRNWLLDNTNYVTVTPEKLLTLPIAPGTDPTYNDMYNIWNIRKDVLVRRQSVFDIEDLVKIPNKEPQQNKIVICPLTDAPYNTYRNWPMHLLQHIVTQWHCQKTTHELIIACPEPISGLDIGYGKYSHKFEDNLLHVQQCRTFIGGETGFTKFASALDPSPQEALYYYSAETYGTTLPFRWTQFKHRIIYYTSTGMPAINPLL